MWLYIRPVNNIGIWKLFLDRSIDREVLDCPDRADSWSNVFQPWQLCMYIFISNITLFSASFLSFQDSRTIQLLFLADWATALRFFSCEHRWRFVCVNMCDFAHPVNGPAFYFIIIIFSLSLLLGKWPRRTTKLLYKNHAATTHASNVPRRFFLCKC